jgi:hypothetical protein
MERKYAVSTATAQVVADSVDRLVSIGPPKDADMLDAIWKAAHAKQGDAPVLLAALGILNAVGKGDVVIIATGFPVLPHNRGEQDGPVGAATLARALVIGLAARPVFVTETINVPLVQASVAAAGLNVRTLEDTLRLPASAAIIDFPMEVEAGRAMGDALLRDLKPKALIAIEKPGANENGEYHNGAGNNISAYCCKSDYLFEKARASGIFTVGIGDRGNELGSVKIKDTVVKSVPNAALCKCPCQGTFVPRVETDVLVMSVTSNTGAWGIEACMAFLLGRPEVLHDKHTNLRVHEQCALAGGNDGPRHLLIPGTDAMPMYVHQDTIELMGHLVERAPYYDHWVPYPWLA